jgi:hypothetical protein
VNLPMVDNGEAVDDVEMFFAKQQQALHNIQA